MEDFRGIWSAHSMFVCFFNVNNDGNHWGCGGELRDMINVEIQPYIFWIKLYVFDIEVTHFQGGKKKSTFFDMVFFKNKWLYFRK